MRPFLLILTLVFTTAVHAQDSFDAKAIAAGERFIALFPVKDYATTPDAYVTGWEVAMGIADLVYLKQSEILPLPLLPKFNLHIAKLRTLPEQQGAYTDYNSVQRDAESLRQMLLMYANVTDGLLRGDVSEFYWKQVKFYVEQEGQLLAEKLRGKPYQCKNEDDGFEKRIWEMKDC